MNIHDQKKKMIERCTLVLLENTGPVFFSFKNDGSFKELISRYAREKSIIYFTLMMVVPIR